MSNRNIAIAAAALIAIAGIVYTQQADTTEVAATEATTETTEVTTNENNQDPETSPATNTAEDASEINTTVNAVETTPATETE